MAQGVVRRDCIRSLVYGAGVKAAGYWNHQYRFRPDVVTSQNLKDSRSHCENVPRIYSGVMYGFLCPPMAGKPENLNDTPSDDHGPGAVPVIAIEFVASGVLDTLLPYTIYRRGQGRQHRDLPLAVTTGHTFLDHPAACLPSIIRPLTVSCPGGKPFSGATRLHAN